MIWRFAAAAFGVVVECGVCNFVVHQSCATKVWCVISLMHDPTIDRVRGGEIVMIHLLRVFGLSARMHNAFDRFTKCTAFSQVCCTSKNCTLSCVVDVTAWIVMNCNALYVT